MPALPFPFAARFREARREAPVDAEPELEAALVSLVDRAAAAWPELPLDPLDFVDHLARHAPLGPPVEALERVHAEDLYLALGCSRGLAAAHRAFDARWLARVQAELARKPAFAAVAEDAVAQLRQKLLLPTATGQTKLADYQGVGPLLALVRAAAVRTALNLNRARLPSDRVAPVDESAVLLSSDPELDFLKASHREHFAAAFRDALAALPDQRLNVLRLYLVDGLNIEKIGVLYQSHRSTVARWIAEAREVLLLQTRVGLAQRLQLRLEEVDSVVRALRSQLELSLRSALEGRAR